MSSPKTKKFWIKFWVVSFLFLSAWLLFWQLKNNRLWTVDFIINILPISTQRKDEFLALNHFSDLIISRDGTERTFMIIFQNNMELRPGGGHIGSFGILKVKNGVIGQIKTYDLSSFDTLLDSKEEAPYPIEKVMHTSSWKMRDSNFSPDFPINAKKASEFYALVQKNQKPFDGLIAINTDVLETFLRATGPIEIPGYPGRYGSGNAIIALEYQVEKGYVDQGIDKINRKSIMNSLADEIIKKASQFNLKQKVRLVNIILEDLRNKDIQLYFTDPELEKYALAANWAGKVDESWSQDYLMMVDANLGSFKSDYYVKRSFEYKIDLSKDSPEATLKITYNHTAKEKDWMTRDYLTYLRLYVPNVSSMVSSSGLDDLRQENDFNKSYFGSLVAVPLGESRTIEIAYRLPENIKNRPYDLLIQKQSGLENVPGKIEIIQKDGTKIIREVNIERDWKLSDSE